MNREHIVENAPQRLLVVIWRYENRYMRPPVGFEVYAILEAQTAYVYGFNEDIAEDCGYENVHGNGYDSCDTFERPDRLKGELPMEPGLWVWEGTWDSHWTLREGAWRRPRQDDGWEIFTGLKLQDGVA